MRQPGCTGRDFCFVNPTRYVTEDTRSIGIERKPIFFIDVTYSFSRSTFSDGGEPNILEILP